MLRGAIAGLAVALVTLVLLLRGLLALLEPGSSELAQAVSGALVAFGAAAVGGAAGAWQAAVAGARSRREIVFAGAAGLIAEAISSTVGSIARGGDDLAEAEEGATEPGEGAPVAPAVDPSTVPPVRTGVGDPQDYLQGPDPTPVVAPLTEENRFTPWERLGVSEEAWQDFEDAVLDEANPSGWKGLLFGPSVAGVTLDENGELAYIEFHQSGVGGGVVKGLGRLLGAGSARTVGQVASSAAARVPGPLRSVLARAGVVPSQGYSSFGAFKRALGPAGPGRQWHHVVEQTPGNVSRFGTQNVHNTRNLVPLERSVHRRISAFYSSKQPFSGGLTVRAWLRQQPLNAQRRFGERIMQQAKDGRL